MAHQPTERAELGHARTSLIAGPVFSAARRAVGRTGVRVAAGVVALTLALSACGSSSSPASSNEGEGGDPVKGGTLRVLAAGGGVKNLDPQTNEGTAVDQPRWAALFDKLMVMSPEGTPEPSLAESIEPNDDATEWTITLRDDAVLHSGRLYNADDLIFSIERILDPATGAKGKDALTFIDPAGIEKVDEYTVKLNLKQPYGPVREAFTTNYVTMVPKDFDPENPDGTGPFTLDSYTPGQESTMSRFDDYWGQVAYVDKLVITEVADSAAQVNALRGGQAEIIDAVPPAEIKAIEAAGDLQIYRSPTWQYFPIIMNVDVAPFDDPRVRQALRLVADRQQMVDVALNGYGEIANDYASRTDACEQPDLAQREQDIEEAKRLLAEAGQSDLQLELVTTAGTAGMAETAPVFAEQAKAAGIDVEVRNVDIDTYLGKYGQWPFAVDWIIDDYVGSVQRTLLPGGAYNNSHFNDEEYNELAADAFAIADDQERCEAYKEMKTIEYERGASIVWGFSDAVHAYANNVHGLQPNVAGQELDHLNEVWIAQG